MIDFVIATLITIVTNIWIVMPYFDVLRDNMNARGVESGNTVYYILCGFSYLAVGLVIYGIIHLIKFLIKQLGYDN